MKKLVTLLMAVAMMFSVCACSPRDDDGGDYVATLRIGYWKGGYGNEFMDYWTSEYNKAHPDEKIKFKTDDTVMTSAMGNRLENSAELCDLFFALATDWSDWARNGWIQPLDDLYEMKNDDGNVYGESFASGMEQYGKLNGTRYVVPLSGAQANGFVYSQKLFDDNKWSVPTTVDELYELVDKINALPCNTDNNPSNDLAPFAFGGQVIKYWDSVVMRWWAQYDGIEKVTSFFDPAGPEVYLPENREGLKKALDIFRSLVCSGEGVPKNALPQAMSKNHILMQNDFVQGKAAMLVGVYGVQNETAAIIPEDFDMRMFMPSIEGAKTENGKVINVNLSTDFDFIFIPKAISEENKKYAKKFLLWISTQDMAEAWLKYTNSMSPFKCDNESVQGLSSLTKSIVENSKDLHVILGTSDNPLTQSGKIVPWPAGEPYSRMILENQTSNAALKDQFNYVNEHWNEWKKDAGVVD